jgi:predicted metal-dependent phosphoesterase TrpH
MGVIDLHTHSTFSDGIVSPTALLQHAKERGLIALALTDHETVAGLDEARLAAKDVGIDFVPGVELNTDVGRHEVHILGYYIDDTDPVLLDALNLLERQRAERIERMVHQLQSIGVPLELGRVRELAGQGTTGRPHLARAMIELGFAESVGDAFDRSSGRPGFVPRQKNDPEAAVRLIRSNGAVPVLAHPRTTGDIEGILSRLVPAGLLGFEVYYGEYDMATRQELRAIADRWQLIPTGGSDYHGEGFKAGRSLGGPSVPPETVELLRTAADRNRAAQKQDEGVQGAS